MDNKTKQDKIEEEDLFKEILTEEDEVITTEKESEEDDLVVILTMQEERDKKHKEKVAKDRLDKLKKEKDLEDRFKALKDCNNTCAQLGISNSQLYFNQHIFLEHSDDVSEDNMKKLEKMDAKLEKEAHNIAYLDNRVKEYSKIDGMFMEAMAEKEAGEPAKLKKYLKLRKAIKSKYPKPE